MIFFGSRCLINSDHLQMSRTKQNVCHLTFFSALCSFVVVAFSDFSIFVFMQLKSRTIQKRRRRWEQNNNSEISIWSFFTLHIFVSSSSLSTTTAKSFRHEPKKKESAIILIVIIIVVTIKIKSDVVYSKPLSLSNTLTIGCLITFI